MQEFSQRLPDTATVMAAVAVNLADRGSIFASYLDINTPAEIAYVRESLARDGWPVVHDPVTDNLLLDDDTFDAEHEGFDFELDGVTCRCRDLREHLRHLVDDERPEYRRLVIQETFFPLLMRLTSRPGESATVH